MAGEAVIGAVATGLGDALTRALDPGAGGTAAAETTDLTVDQVKDIIALIFSASNIPPKQIIARFNAVRPLFDEPEYVKWLGY